MKILITGGTGTIGMKLTEKFLERGDKVALFDNSEAGIFWGMDKFGDKVKFILGSVTDRQRIIEACEGIDVVIHGAALKHVHIGEYNPYEVVKTDIIATKNVVDAAKINNCKNLVFMSSVKAVNPEGVYGSAKKVGEKIVLHAGYTATRFANVINSKGSVFETWREQKARGEPLTLTDKRMERLWMTLEDAVDLIIHAIEIKGKLVISKKVERKKVLDVIKEISNNYKETGIRPGELLKHESMTELEKERAEEDGDYWLISYC